MLKKCLTMFIMLIVILGVIGGSFSAYAYTTYNDHRFEQGIQGVSCQNSINSTLYPEVYAGVNQAIADWDWHLGLLNEWYNVNWNLVTVSGLASPMIEFVMVDTEDDFPYFVWGKNYAVTAFYDRNMAIIDPDDMGTTNWYYTKVFFAKERLDESGYLNDAAVIRSMANHEIGHTLGLDHSTDFGVIMHTPYEERTAYVPTMDDLQGVYHLYG